MKLTEQYGNKCYRFVCSFASRLMDWWIKGLILQQCKSKAAMQHSSIEWDWYFVKGPGWRGLARSGARGWAAWWAWASRSCSVSSATKSSPAGPTRRTTWRPGTGSRSPGPSTRACAVCSAELFGHCQSIFGFAMQSFPVLKICLINRLFSSFTH